ncbi:MAG: tripartite tricarboxylate transporter permease [Desulfobacterales bacterium]|nr:tripartite tricarboxylate transporter permease [Desulfobacterales bacterium]
MESVSLDVMASGLTLLLHPNHLMWLALGMVAGLVVGAIPGFNDTNFLAMMLPFSVYLGAMDAVVFMMACFCSSQAAGSFPAILLNIPGTPSNAPTCIEGFRMTRKGMAGQALGISIMASTVGGLLSALFAVVLTPIVGVYALNFGPAELFMLALFGMTAVGSLTGKSTTKGLFSSALGLFVACVGTEFQQGYTRASFGFYELFEGFPLIPVLLGVFGFAELFSLVKEDSIVEKGHRQFSGYAPIFQGIRTALGQWGNMIRSGMIGILVGLIPGTGAAIATWVSYGQAKQWSRTPEKFGTGHAEGLVASDACNNGVPGGALIPTVTLGIPGSGTTLVVMAALMINGVTPGPSFFGEHAVEAYAILFSLVVANLLLLPLGLGVARLATRVTAVPNRFLVPIIALFCMAGSFAWRQMVFDMNLVLVFGVFGALLNRYGYSVPAFLLALLLGPLAERNFIWAVQIGGTDSFLRPIALVILIATVGVLVLPVFMKQMALKGKT